MVLDARPRTSARLWANAGSSRLGVGKVSLAHPCHQAAGAIVQGVSAAYYSDEHPMAQRKHEPGPPIDLENMRRQGVCNLVAYCLNDACRNQAVIDVSSYPGDTLVPWFKTKVKCAKCGGRGHKIDVMPNWKEADPVQDWRGRAAMPGGEN
jgi:hypothetical protein